MSIVSGVYKIECNNGWAYVGSSKNVAYRLTRHKCLLRGDCHSRRRLQRDWNTLGAEAFTFTLVEEVPPLNELLDEAENRHIAETKYCYNASRKANRFGRKDHSRVTPRLVSGPDNEVAHHARLITDEEYEILIQCGPSYWNPHYPPPAQDIIRILLPYLYSIIESQQKLLGMRQINPGKTGGPGVLTVPFSVANPGSYLFKLKHVSWSAPEILGIFPVEG